MNNFLLLLLLTTISKTTEKNNHILNIEGEDLPITDYFKNIPVYNFQNNTATENPIFNNLLQTNSTISLLWKGLGYSNTQIPDLWIKDTIADKVINYNLTVTTAKDTIMYNYMGDSRIKEAFINCTYENGKTNYKVKAAAEPLRGKSLQLANHNIFLKDGKVYITIIQEFYIFQSYPLEHYFTPDIDIINEDMINILTCSKKTHQGNHKYFFMTVDELSLKIFAFVVDDVGYAQVSIWNIVKKADFGEPVDFTKIEKFTINLVDRVYYLVLVFKNEYLVVFNTQNKKLMFHKILEGDIKFDIIDAAFLEYERSPFGFFIVKDLGLILYNMDYDKKFTLITSHPGVAKLDLVYFKENLNFLGVYINNNPEKGINEFFAELIFDLNRERLFINKIYTSKNIIESSVYDIDYTASAFYSNEMLYLIKRGVPNIVKQADNKFYIGQVAEGGEINLNALSTNYDDTSYIMLYTPKVQLIIGGFKLTKPTTLTCTIHKQGNYTLNLLGYKLFDIDDWLYEPDNTLIPSKAEYHLEVLDNVHPHSYWIYYLIGGSVVFAIVVVVGVLYIIYKKRQSAAKRVTVTKMSNNDIYTPIKS
jgi:hypothetical protein